MTANVAIGDLLCLSGGHHPRSISRRVLLSMQSGYCFSSKALLRQASGLEGFLSAGACAKTGHQSVAELCYPAAAGVNGRAGPSPPPADMAEAEYEVASLTDLVELPPEGFPAVIDRGQILGRRVPAPK